LEEWEARAIREEAMAHYDTGIARETMPDHPTPNYVFDNAATQTPSRFAALARSFDPGTMQHLTDLGVANGWRCLEVGGGGGSVTIWLCDRVSPDGHVVVTDIDTRFLERLARDNLEVWRHNIVVDPLPQAAFDLVHVRLLLMLLPQREDVLARLIGALKPGGWLLAEEFDSVSARADRSINAVEAPCRTYVAVHRVMTDRGADLRYGRLLAGRMKAHGLRDTAAEGRMFMCPCGSEGADLLRANMEELHDVLIDCGLITQMEFDEDLAHLNNPDFMVPSPIMWSVRGRRPAAG
jgi:SAM-dependent methyltransferase